MAAGGYHRIDVAAARAAIGQKNPLVLDVRDADSYRRGHIEGAQLATQENFSRHLSETAKDRPIIVCCYHGNSSQTVAKFLADMGFSNVSSLDGGYEAWAASKTDPQTPARLSDASQAFLAEHGFAPGAVNGFNKDRATPLMLAARLAPTALVRELVAAGADIHAENGDGNQALWLACVGEIT
jgi:rhodanese-related sulfurtransferase